jgi:hypothetical protein
MDKEKREPSIMAHVSEIGVWAAEEIFIETALAKLAKAIVDYPERTRGVYWSVEFDYKPVGKDGRDVAKTVSVETDQRGVGFDESNEGTEFLARQEASTRFLEMKRKQYEHENSLYGTTMWEGDKK